MGMGALAKAPPLTDEQRGSAMMSKADRALLVNRLTNASARARPGLFSLTVPPCTEGTIGILASA
jgi:hypothetical protein